MNDSLKSISKAELRARINTNSIVLSLLYDLGLLPEQVGDDPQKWGRIASVVQHIERAIAAPPDAQPRTAEPAGCGYPYCGGNAPECKTCLGRRAEPAPAPADEPTTHELTVQLREALGLFAGAMPVTPKAAWDEALDVLRQRLNTTADEPPPLTDAASSVLAERRRQVESEGWTAEHDDEHTDRSMAWAAACYARCFHPSDSSYPDGSPPLSWPASWHTSWWKPLTDYRRNLVKAGALILAEIERLDRIAKLQAERSKS